MSAKDYDKMTVVNLRDELKARDLPIEGKKAELVERLKAADKAVEEEILNASLENVNNMSAEDLLNDEELLGDLPSHQPQKEVTVTKTPIVPPADAVTSSVTTETVKPTDATDEKKATKKTDLSSSEAKLARAARFGLPVGAAAAAVTATAISHTGNATMSADAKAKRAERFGLSSIQPIGTAPAAAGDNLTNLTSSDAKAKRLARFGLPTAAGATTTTASSTPAKGAHVDEATKEKLLKRAQRFGLPVNSEGKTTASSDAELDTKKKARLERFGGETAAV